MPESSSQVETAPKARQYVVVARRYRPQTFEELVGQEHVAQALSNAITTKRVGHAYLFTGARGVGKTSAARILGETGRIWMFLMPLAVGAAAASYRRRPLSAVVPLAAAQWIVP